MKFYLDFEATDKQEIISIGAVSEHNETFHMYVKPSFSKLTPYISNLTGITNEILETAEDFTYVVLQLLSWTDNVERKHDTYINRITREFYSYGSSDVLFLKNTLKNIQYNADAYMFICQIIATLQNYETYTNRYFCGKIKLIDAYNFIQQKDKKQKHNALEDAKMLAAIAKAIDGAEPLKNCPIVRTKIINQAPENYKFPSGRFTAKSTGKHPKVYTFSSCEKAINWIINNKIYKNDRENVRKDKIAERIMKSIRQKSLYFGYTWERTKEEC